MHINVNKIEERIQKLQEIKRIAADPELLRMIAEFVIVDYEAVEPPPAARAAAASASASAGVSHPDDADIVNQVVKGMDGAGASLWSRKRA